MSYNRENAGAAALGFARKLTGEPYLFAGTPPGPTDCSGLTQWSYGKVGVILPRDTYHQYLIHPLPRSAANEAGDLLFIEGSDPLGNAPGHVMIYVEPGWVFQAPFTGESIKAYEYDTDVWEYRTRPALALPLPGPTLAQLNADQMKPIAHSLVAAAVKEGWNIFTWDWKKNVFIKAVPSASGQRYVSIFYPKGK